jgi:hypothetical protein
VRLFGVVIIDRAREDRARMVNREEQRLVEQLVVHATVESFDEPVRHCLARRDIVPSARVLPDHVSTTFEVGSVQSPLTTMLAAPRSAIRSPSSRTTRRPEIDVSSSHTDIFNTSRWNPYREFIAGMNAQERGELRRMIVTTAAEVMRDCDDPEMRADMFDVLRQLEVIHYV